MAKAILVWYQLLPDKRHKNMTHPFYLLPGRRPWSSGKPKYLLGSPGSDRISTSLALVISRLADNDMDLAAAIAAPRFHSSHVGQLLIEKKRFKPKVLDVLFQTGFEIKHRGAYSFYLGCVQGVKLPQHEGELFYGVADPRRDGTAGGPNFNIERG